MAAYPFRKMTTRQLRRLLKDDRERNRYLTEAPDCPDTDQPAFPPIRIQPDPTAANRDSNRVPLIDTSKNPFKIRNIPGATRPLVWIRTLLESSGEI